MCSIIDQRFVKIGIIKFKQCLCQVLYDEYSSQLHVKSKNHIINVKIMLIFSFDNS